MPLIDEEMEFTCEEHQMGTFQEVCTFAFSEAALARRFGHGIGRHGAGRHGIGEGAAVAPTVSETLNPEYAEVPF